MTGPRVVLYGVGAMGSVIARMVLAKGGEIVGAVARSPEKVGKDVAEVAGLPEPLGVTVSDDGADVVGSTKPDLVIMTIASYMGDVFEPMKTCLGLGANVVSLSEEVLYSWTTSPEQTAELDAIAREHGVTLTCTGHQDAYWVSLVATMMGTSFGIESVDGQASWNVDDFGPELANGQFVGQSREDFDAWVASGDDRPPTFGRTSIEAITAMSGLTVERWESTTRPDLAEGPVECTALGITVEPGKLIGFTDIDTAYTAEGPVIRFEMTGKVYVEGESDMNHWTINGEKPLELRNDHLYTDLTTCATLVNRVPDVIAAEPGYQTLDKLPPLKYRVTY